MAEIFSKAPMHITKSLYYLPCTSQKLPLQQSFMFFFNFPPLFETALSRKHEKIGTHLSQYTREAYGHKERKRHPTLPEN